MIVPAAAIRDDIASYVQGVAFVYVLILVAAVIVSIYASFGGRIPYNRPLRMVLDFLDQVTAPLLRFIRQYVPRIGPFDFSPMVAIFGVGLLGNLLAQIIAH